MNAYTSSSAYSFEYYGDVKPKKETKQKAETIKNNSPQWSRTKIIVWICFIFVAVGIVGVRSASLSGERNEINQKENEFNQLKMENEQKRAEIENSIDMGRIEEYAENELGMIKANNSDIVYINPTHEDNMEKVSKTTKENANFLGITFANLSN